MKQKIVLCFLIGFSLFPHIVWADDETTAQEATEQLKLLDTKDIEALLVEIDAELEQYLPSGTLSNFVERFIKGEITLDFETFTNGIMQIFRRELAYNVTIVGKLIFLVIMSAVLGNLGRSFTHDTVGKLANLVVMSMILLLIVHSVQLVIDLGQSAIERMVRFMQLLMPIQFVLMASLGNGAAVSALQPSLYIGVNLMGNLFRYLVFPLIYFEVVLKIANNLSVEFSMDKFASLFRQIILAAISVSSSLFLALISIQGFGSAVIDGMGVRTVKYVAGAFIPVVGNMLSDIYETVISGSLLIKNAFGILGLLVIILLTLLPAVKIFIIYLLYKFTGAMVQPLGEKQATAMISDIGDSFLLIFAAVAFVAVTFFFTIVILTTTANITLMMR